MTPRPTDIASQERDAVVLQLEAILRSEAFRGSDRSTKLLRYLVEQTLKGQAESLKEYTIGTEALGRNTSFDPRLDHIVRAEASRLRSRLDKYYANDGQADRIVISLPKGTYVPRFHTSTETERRPAATDRPLTLSFSRGRTIALGAAIACVLVTALAWSFSRPSAPGTPIPIAVLPFANMSPDPGQEFFSDGVSEEIMTALAKVPSLSVVGRASAFQFKGTRANSRTAGQALGARYLVEGSVRKSGDQVRIAAQLVDVQTGLSLWTESYDRELRDIFETQSQIAEAVVDALQLTLGVGQARQLVANRTDDLASYEDFLHARALYRTRAIDGVLTILEPLVVRDSDFAPAWSLLAQAYFLFPLYGFADSNAEARAIWDKAEKAAQTAIQRDPDNGPALSVLADLDYARGYWTKGEDGFRKALELDPTNPDILNRFSARLGTSGRVKEALSLSDRVRTFEPFVPSYNITAARLMVTAGQTRSAIAILEKTLPETPLTYYRHLYLARAYAAERRYQASADTLLATPPLNSSTPGHFENAARIIRGASQEPSSPETLPAVPGGLNFVYAHVGALNRVLETLAEAPDNNGPAYDILWQAEAAPLRKTPQFKKTVTDVGLVQLWRARGWPDLCRPLGNDDFVCD